MGRIAGALNKATLELLAKYNISEADYLADKTLLKKAINGETVENNDSQVEKEDDEPTPAKNGKFALADGTVVGEDEDEDDGEGGGDPRVEAPTPKRRGRPPGAKKAVEPPPVVEDEPEPIVEEPRVKKVKAVKDKDIPKGATAEDVVIVDVDAENKRLLKTNAELVELLTTIIDSAVSVDRDSELIEVSTYQIAQAEEYLSSEAFLS